MSDLFPNRPAIVAEAETPELEQLAYQASSALEAADAEGSSYLSRMKEAGEHLLKAKKKCKHGQWIPWLNKHGINRMQAFRALKAFSKCNTLLHLDEALPEIAEAKEEEEAELPDQSLVYCGRNCRVGLGPSKCRACAKARHEAKKQAEEEAAKSRPILSLEEIKANKLKAILDLAVIHQKLADRLVSFSKRIREIERSDLYRKASGDRSETFAETLLKASKQIVATAPVKACELCNGELDPSPDSPPCGDCGGKGVLTAAEAQAIKERLNF